MGLEDFTGAEGRLIRMRKRLSIVVPVYQNEPNLPDSVPALLALREKLPDFEFELVFVDDGSTDRSFLLLQEFAQRNSSCIKVVRLSRNFGQTPAIQAGLRIATGDCVGVISADLQEPHELFIDMVDRWERGAKFVIGEREARDEGWLHQAVSGLYWRLIRKFAIKDFPKLGYDFFLIDRQLVDDVNRINEKNTSVFVLLFWLGYRPTRLPITRRLRTKGRSQWKFGRKFMLTLDTLMAFSYLPARLISSLGVTTGLACLAYLLYVLVVWALHHSAPPGWMTVVGLITLLGSLILISLGIIGEYLLRILDEARKRPPYVVDSLTPEIPDKRED